jgi:hypothetical protein
MSEHFAEIIGADGRRRRARKGDVLADGERFSLPMQFMDSQLRDELVAKHRDGGAVRVVDTAGMPAGHRPGFLFDSTNSLADAAADAAYLERTALLDAKARKRRADPDDEDDDEGEDARGRDPHRAESEMERRQRLARKAARETFRPDARSLSLDAAQALADAAREARDERLRTAWRTR